MAHYMQNLINLPVTGETPATDPEFGWQYEVVNQIAIHLAEIEEEIGFTSIRTSANGEVHLMLHSIPVSTARMSSHHADATLVLGDPE